jgi:hypothetical protein
VAIRDLFVHPPPGGKPPEVTKPPADNSKPPESPVTVYRYRCVEACVFQKIYRKAGDIVELTEKRGVPHFVPVE